MRGSPKPPTDQQQLLEVLTSIADRLCEIRDLLRPQMCRTCATDPCPLPSGPDGCEGYSYHRGCDNCVHGDERIDEGACKACTAMSGWTALP